MGESERGGAERGERVREGESEGDSERRWGIG